MIPSTLWLSLLVLGVSSQERNSEGLLKMFDGCTLRPWERTCNYTSFGFPNQAPHQLRQSGRFGCYNPPEERTSIKLFCPIIDIPKSADGTCETKFYMEDVKAKNKTFYCGTYKDLSIVSYSTDFYLEITNGARGGGLVNCTVDCVWLGPDGNVEYPTPHPYLTHDFSAEEEDSSEYGTYPGPKETTCPCGTANKMSSRIVNGTIASKNEFPFIAALVKASSLWQFCGAPIITAFHALTAAHCTAKPIKNNEQLAIIVAAHDLNEKPDPSNVYNVKQIIPHENYNKGTVNAHDITLLYLEREIQFSPVISRVCLPTHQMDLSHQQAKVIGWGAQTFMGRGSDLLRKLNIRVLTNDECRLKMTNIPKDQNPIYLCTYRQSRASCQGDSGGPVVWLDPETNRFTLIGLVSFGMVCGDEFPSFHTNVGAHLPWIYEHIEATKPVQACTKRLN